MRQREQNVDLRFQAFQTRSSCETFIKICAYVIRYVLHSFRTTLDMRIGITDEKRSNGLHERRSSKQSSIGTDGSAVIPFVGV